MDTKTTTSKKPYHKKQTTNTEGKLMPQAPDIEEAILGALMLGKIPKGIWAQLKPEMFYLESHKHVLQALVNLNDERKVIDLLTVKNQLQKNGVLEAIGGAYYLTTLTDRVANSTNIEYHIAIITEKFLSRQLIELSYETINNCYNDEGSGPLAEMSTIVSRVDDLKKGIFKRTEKRMDEILFHAETEMYRDKPNGLLGTSTGSRGLDHIIKGYQDNQLVIIAARPAMGKTAEMCSQILSIGYADGDITKQEPVGVFSLEMSSIQLGFRMWSNVSSVPNNSIKTNLLNSTERGRIQDFKDRLSEAPIYIDDTAGLTIDEFEAKVALWVSLYGVRKVFLDYLQLMKGSPSKKYGNREAEVSDISRRLKIVAKEHGITIIALCQLSREVEKRKFCIPILSDLRESGSIEQDADVVYFLWRPEYYPEVMKELKELDIKLFNFTLYDFQGLIINLVAKCREEKTGKVPLKFNGSIMRVYDHPNVLDALNQLSINSGASELAFTTDSIMGDDPF